MRGLDGKCVVVAGGGTGIGAGTAERLGEEGSRVVVGDLDLAAAQATAQRITDAGGTAEAVWFDLADEESVRALFAAAVERFGGVDGLFNVAADASADVLGRDGDLLTMDPAVWRRTLEVNLVGFALTCRAALPLLLAEGGGSIVNTSSLAAHVGDLQRAAYQTSKAGINALTRHVAARWGKQGVRCNAVSPGVVLTESSQRMALTREALEHARATMPSPRFGTPSDLAGVVAFLLSDDAEWVNGQVWSVNGGSHLRE